MPSEYTLAMSKNSITANDFLKEGLPDQVAEDDSPIVDWHHDSYPFVCVTMLSDCTGMVGGETALKTARGNILKVRGPEMVCSEIG